MLGGFLLPNPEAQPVADISNIGRVATNRSIN